MDSILKKLIADVCVDSGLEESKLDKGFTLKLLARRIGTTKLEANIIAGYEKRLRDAEWRIIVSAIHVPLKVHLTLDIVFSHCLCHHLRECVGGCRRIEPAAVQ